MVEFEVVVGSPVVELPFIDGEDSVLRVKVAEITGALPYKDMIPIVVNEVYELPAELDILDMRYSGGSVRRCRYLVDQIVLGTIVN